MVSLDLNIITIWVFLFQFPPPKKYYLIFMYYGINIDKITLSNLVANVNFYTLKDYGLRLGNRYLASASKVYHNTLRGEI